MSRYFNKEAEEYYLWTDETGAREHTGTVLDWKDPGPQGSDQPVDIGCMLLIMAGLAAAAATTGTIGAILV